MGLEAVGKHAHLTFYMDESKLYPGFVNFRPAVGQKAAATGGVIIKLTVGKAQQQLASGPCGTKLGQSVVKRGITGRIARIAESSGNRRIKFFIDALDASRSGGTKTVDAA